MPLQIEDYDTMVDTDDEMFEPIRDWQDAAQNLLSVADATVKRRDRQYGDAYQHHATTAQMWSAYLGVRVQPEQVSMMFILDKIVRSKQQAKPDNLTDIAGYAAVHARVQATKQRVSSLIVQDTE